MSGITRESIGTMFGNAENGQEGFGVFLVVGIGPPRLEVQRVDERAAFPSDVAARRWLWHQAAGGSKRHGEVLAALRAADEVAFQQVMIDGLWGARAAAT